jgi:hypothetical protein
MHRGFIKIWRKITEWEWYSDAFTFRLFTHLLIKANYKDGRYMGHDILRGQLVSGITSLAENTGLTSQNVRTALDHLKNSNEITIKSTNRFSIITLCNYDKYQNQEIETNTQPNKQLTNDQQATNKQLTTSKEFKNLKECKNEKNNTCEWKNHFWEYYKLIVLAFRDISSDIELRKKLESLHPGLDIGQSIRLGIFNFWGRKSGWENKKKASRGKPDYNPNMKMTLIKNIDRNRVWKPKENNTAPSYDRLTDERN